MAESYLFINCPEWAPKGDFRYFLNGLEVTYIDNELPLDGLRFFTLVCRPA